ncbi:MAG: protein-L-isoaspartate O-methyltransferase family protein [Caulobacterales bacterium]
MDFERARHWMVEAQVRPNDVTDPAVLGALRQLPRERFAPAFPDIAYSDLELEVAPGRFLLRPRDLGKLIQILSPRAGETAMEICGATGYGAAVLASIGSASVVTLDSDPALAHAAQTAISACGLSQVIAASGDVKAGYRDRAPYDVILVSAGVEFVPQAWLDQLAEGGRLAVVVRNGAAGSARLYLKAGGLAAYRTAFDAAPPVAPDLKNPPAFTF